MSEKLADMYNFSSKLWFNKRRIASNGEVSLYLQVIINGRHKEFPLKLKWSVEHIDIGKGCLLPRAKKDPDVNDFNMLIMMEQGNHTEIIRTYRIKKAPIDITTFTREVQTFDRKTNFISWMHDEIQSRFRRKEISQRTYLNHKSANAAMIGFDSAWPFEMLDAKWMKKFRTYLQAEGYEPGGIWTIIKFVKTYLQLAYLEPMIYVEKAAADFSNPMPSWSTTYLNNDEVRRLLILMQSGNVTLEQQAVLKAFLFQCFTSLRVSDVYRANSKWQVSDGFLTFIPKKNEKRQKWLSIPIMPMAEKLIRSSLDKFFDLPSEQEYNVKLKEIAVKADIRKNLTSHVGRHTFGYLFMTTVGNIKALQEIMGHTKVETTMRYAHLDETYKAASVKRIQESFNDLFMWRSS